MRLEDIQVLRKMARCYGTLPVKRETLLALLDVAEAATQLIPTNRRFASMLPTSEHIKLAGALRRLGEVGAGQYYECTGCAYNVDDEVLRANCVGCQGFGPKTPHYVPASPDAPRNWWEYKPQEQPAEPCAPWRSDYDPASVKSGPVVILDDDGEV